MATNKKSVEDENVVEEKQEVQGKDFDYIFLPLLTGRDAVQQEFFSVNFKNYIIKRGVRTKVPIEVAKVWRNAQAQETERILYAQNKGLRQPE